MKEYNILSWGGGTQSTALLLKFMNGEIKNKNNEVIKIDYVFFADTGNESKMVYEQIFKVQKYIKDKYDFDVIITKKNKELKPDEEIIKLIQGGLKYRGSKYADLYQSHLLYFQGHIKAIDVMPFWTRNIYGEVGKTPFKACTMAYKIKQIMKELRIVLGIKSFDKTKHKLNMYIGYSIDEIGRVKPNPLSYVENISPLVDLHLSRYDCVDYVEKKLGFTPLSSVCNMCYANDFNRVYDIYENDVDGWNKLLALDDAMANKPKSHRLREQIFMFRFQALDNIRLKDVSMKDLKEKYRKKFHQLSIFDMEQEMACMGGCFL